MSRARQVLDDLTLTSIFHLTIADEGCQYLYMAKILAPRLELLWGHASNLAQLNKGISKAVWVEIGQTGTFKRITENLTDRRGVTPMTLF